MEHTYCESFGTIRANMTDCVAVLLRMSTNYTLCEWVVVAMSWHCDRVSVILHNFMHLHVTTTLKL